MKTTLKILGSLLLLGLITLSSQAANFTPGNVVVSQYGDGSGALSSAAAPVAVLEYLPSTANQASPVQTIAIPSTGGSRLTGSGSAGSEDYITRSMNATILTFGGYDTDAGTLNVAAGTTAAAVNRVVGQVDSSGNYTRTATGSTTMYTSGNIRSVVSDGINYWMAGSVGGIWYSAGGATPASVGGGNFRVARIFNGNLYYSASTAISGFSGLPTTTAAGTATGITGSSVYDFAISPAGNVAYVADDSTLATVGGIAKWTFNGSTWTKKFTFGSPANTASNNLTAGCRGLAVDFSGPNPVLYAATSDSLSKLIKITDTSAFSDTSDNADQAIILATAAANYAFKGVALAPTTTPVIISQPSDVNNALVGTTVNLAVSATGGQPLAYQWYYTNTNTKLVDGSSGYGGTISGSTNATLTLTSVATNQIGGYQVVITNTSGSITSRVAQVTIVTALVPPTIDANISPIGSTNFVGDTVAFSVTAHGIPAVAYQWKWIPDTNNLVTNIISGANSPTFPLVNLTTNQSGKYFVTITNSAAYYTTNSAMAVLKVNPTPVLTIAQFRSMVNGSYAPTNTTAIFTIQGTVTTWADMTGSANTEFYMQDASGGIVVYWGGASATTNLPPAGAIVRVTGPLASFSGLLEISPVFGNPLHSVTVVSTGNPLPAAQPLPFDPNVTGSLATMKAMEGMYFVASNVMLNVSTPNFVSGANDTITNNVTNTRTFSDSNMTVSFTNGAGQTFILFINAYSDIPNKVKYTGPVTIYGVLGYYSSAGFEFTPSRFADIISYTHFTNVLSNVTRSGDLLTNTFNESVLRPTETLTLSVAIADAGGGSVSLAPSTDGLPGSASWDAPVNGTTATTTFHFTPTSSDAGSNYVVGLASTTPGGTSSNFWYIYVPTPDEQQMYISEFLANPTTNTGAPYFNPLHRTVDGINITTWDQYVEIANVSGATFDLYGWSITDASQTRHTFLIGAPTEQLGSSSAVVVYGGGKVGDPSPPNLSVSAFPANIGGSPSLSLAKSGRGVIVLRNPGYYNNALGNKPGYIVDRVVYNSSDLNNGSLSRFPTLNGALVPQAYISTRTNFTTAGLQYDGSPWSAPTQTPASVGNIVITAGNPVNLSFTANTNNGTTLWVANSLNDKFSVVFGNQFTNAAAQFQITNPPSTMQFYFITTQTNF